MKFESEFKHFHWRKYIWKCRLGNVDHFSRPQCVKGILTRDKFTCDFWELKYLATKVLASVRHSAFCRISWLINLTNLEKQTKSLDFINFWLKAMLETQTWQMPICAWTKPESAQYYRCRVNSIPIRTPYSRNGMCNGHTCVNKN